MNGPENDRPLVALNAAEQSLALERLRGEVWQEFTRIEAVANGRKDALELQAKEYERRLAGLNHEAEQLKTMQAKYVSIDVYGRDMKENEARVRKLENTSENTAGKLWFPMLLIAGIAAGMAALIVKLAVP